MRDSSKNIGVGGESASVSRENIGAGKFGSASGKIYHSMRDETTNLGVDESLIYGENQRSGGERSETGFCENQRSDGVSRGFLRSKAKQSKTSEATA